MNIKKRIKKFFRMNFFGFSGLEIVVVVSVLGGLVWGASKWLGGNVLKKQGTMETQKEFLESKEEKNQEIKRSKNKYIKKQVPRRRKYQQVTSDPDSTADERADATFDLFKRN